MPDQELDATAIARQIATTPGLRAKYFEDAPAAIAGVVGAKRQFGLGVDSETKKLREQALAKVPAMMLEKAEAASSAHSEAVMAQFFKGAIRNPELSFRFILWLSIATFAAGIALVAAGLVTAFITDDATRTTVVASVFGGSGVAGVLGSVYALARRGVSQANANHAQLRLILTGFATELGHLRAYDLNEFDKIEQVNMKIREAMQACVDLIQTCVKVEPKMAARELAGQPGAPPDDGDG